MEAAGKGGKATGTGKGAAGTAGQKEVTGLSRRMRSFLQKQEVSVVAAITACQDVQVQLDLYQTTLTSWGELQQKLEDRLQGLLDQSRSARKLVQQEKSRAAAKKKKSREGELQLHAVLKALRTPATDKDAGVAVAEMLRCTDEAEQVLEECRGCFPDANTATTVWKVTEASNAALEAFQAALENHPSVPGEEPLPQSEADCTIMDRLQAILTTGLKGPLQAKDLRRPTQPVRRLLEAGFVFGVHQVEGRRRHARISLEGRQVYLYTLQEGSLSPFATTLQVSQVVQPSPPRVVFLDLSWPGSAPRRVHVRLSPDTPQGRQAVLLCTGQHGPSYAGTRLFDVWYKGQPGECVWGGDYERNKGRGGAALLPGLGKGAYRVSGKAGSVWGGWSEDPAQGAVFGIITRDCEFGGVCGDVFGEVVQGLDAVVAAAQYTPITKVTIKDCGVVLWG